MQSTEAVQIVTEGLPVVAGGVHGTVYRIGEDRIVKLYNPEISRDQVEKERLQSLEVFRLGIPTAEPFELVREGNRYGIIFEMLRGKTLGHAISAEPERIGEYAEQYAALARKLHETRTCSETVPKLKEDLESRLPRVRDFCTEADLLLLEDLVKSLPEEDCLLHGDLHPGNIMIRDGELILIDLAEVTRGWTVWDLSAIYRDMIIGPLFPTEALEKSIGMKANLILKTGRAFFRAYTGLEGEPVEEYLLSLLPLYGVNTVINLASAEDRNEDSCRRVIPLLMSEAIRKNEKSLRKTLEQGRKGE